MEENLENKENVEQKESTEEVLSKKIQELTDELNNQKSKMKEMEDKHTKQIEDILKGIRPQNTKTDEEQLVEKVINNINKYKR